MSSDAFDLIEQAGRLGGAQAALELLATIARKDQNYSLLFQARRMQARHKIGLPLISDDSLDELSPNQRKTYDEAMREAAREAGSLYLDGGDILRAWPYFRALGDPAPVSAAIEKIESHDQLEGIIEIAFGEGAHPRKGFELLLKHYGICRAITVFQQYPDPQSRGQCALLLLRSLHGELVGNLKHAIFRTEGHQPDASSVSELIRGRDWLFGDLDSYVDTAHLTSVIPLALEFPDPEALHFALELCEYGMHLSPKLQHYRAQPPFEDFYKDHAIYLRAVAGHEIDSAVEHFRGKIGPETAQVLVTLLVRLNRYREAIKVSLEYLGRRHPDELDCPTIPQLCQLAGDYDSLRDFARRRDDILIFTAAAIGGKTAGAL